MKKTILIFAACSILMACNDAGKGKSEDQTSNNNAQVQESPEPTTALANLFTIESGYVKYRTMAAGQEMIREWWFDQHGQRQYEENYMTIMGEKSGSKMLVLDGVQYQWDLNSDTGRKTRHTQAVTDYEKISQRDIDRYGIKKHGHEDVLGKNCLKVTTEKPVKSTVWVWNNIPLKTEAEFGGKPILMEAVEISTSNIEAKRFAVPTDVSFSETN